MRRRRYARRVHVLIAPDSFTGTLTAAQAAEAIAAGWTQSAPQDLITLRPLSDGGPGFVDVLARALPVDSLETVMVTVGDPLGREVPAALLVRTDAGRRTAYLEAATAAGLHLLGADERNPAITSTYGVGQLMRAALDENVDRIVVGVGGCGTNDGGAGMLAALGAGSTNDLARGGMALAQLSDDALAGLAAVRERLAGTQIEVATDLESPLLGLQGASAAFARQKGASPQMAQDLERALSRFAEVARQTIPESADLLTGRPRRLDREPGAGAAGGLAYGLLLLGARRVSGVHQVLDAVGFRALAAAADLVVTGEGCFDWQSLQGKVVSGVAAVTLETATPTVVLAGQVLVGRRESMGLGLSGTYAVANSSAEVQAAYADPVGTLRTRAARVAATWSPSR